MSVATAPHSSGNGARDDETRQRYREQGFAEHRIGFGERPALLIIDMQNDFVDPGAPSTCSPIAQQALPAMRRLLDAARDAAIPVFFSQGIVDLDHLPRDPHRQPRHRRAAAGLMHARRIRGGG